MSHHVLIADRIEVNSTTSVLWWLTASSTGLAVESVVQFLHEQQRRAAPEPELLGNAGIGRNGRHHRLAVGDETPKSSRRNP